LREFFDTDRLGFPEEDGFDLSGDREVLFGGHAFYYKANRCLAQKGGGGMVGMDGQFGIAEKYGESNDRNGREKLCMIGRRHFWPRWG
jgi:hypothetical protein